MDRERAYLDLSGLIAGIQVRQGPEFLFTFIFNGMAIRKSATFFDDQYKFWKSFNSPNLFLACAEYMFEDIEPTGLTEQEKVLFDSLRVRMDNQKKKANAGAKSHGGGRPKTTTEKQQKNNKKTTEQTTEKQEDKDNITNVILLKNKDKVKDKVKDKESKKINKHLYLDFVFLSEDEYSNLISKLGKKLTEELIEKLNNYIGSSGKKYKSHYYTILNRSKKETNGNPNYDMEHQLELHRKKIAEQIQSFNINEKQDGLSGNDVGGYNRRNDIGFS